FRFLSTVFSYTTLFRSSFTVPKDVGAGDFFDISWSDNMNLYGTHDPNDSSYDTGIQITDQEGNVIAKEDKSNITGNKARLVFTEDRKSTRLNPVTFRSR